MESFSVEFLGNVITILSQPVLKLGNTTLTWWSLIYITVLIAFLMITTGRLQRLIIKQAEARTNLDIAATNGISTIVRYLFIGLGFLVILQSAGVDLSSLTIMAGAIGLGLTVGMQSITTNLMSGLTLYTERPIKVGDRVEVDGVVGDITKITFRATTILTDDNIEIIVPNTQFITGKVINWSHSSPTVRLRMPISISTNSDPKQIKATVEDVAKRNEGVLEQPAPELIFVGFGESALKFELSIWTSVYTRQTFVLKSQLYYELFERFKTDGIEIPYPQRDIHIRTGDPAAATDAKRS
jgi:small-conductance mechanosensitive channel